MQAGETKKRGRPLKYADKEERAAAVAERKRNKRRQQVADQRQEEHEHFYVAGPSDHHSSLLPIPGLPRQTNPQSAVRAPEYCGDLDDLLPVIDDEPTVAESDDLSTGHVGASEISERPPADDGWGKSRSSSTQESRELVGSLANCDTTAPVIEVAGDSSQPGPDSAAFEHAQVESMDIETAVSRLAGLLTEQLTSFRGCCHDCHAQGATTHTEEFDQHVSLTGYLDSMTGKCPDLLASPRIAQRQDDLINATAAETRREVYTGLSDQDTDAVAPHLCLEVDEPKTSEAGYSFDIDSIIGFPSSLAIAKQGIRWQPSQPPLSDLRSGLHLRHRQVSFFDETGDQHQVRRPIHHIPHYQFGRVIGFEDASLYFLFPNLYREEQQVSRLRDEDFRLWTDEVLLPIIYRHYSSAHVQHYPSSHDHSRHNATARGVESRAQRTDPVAREQQLTHFLPPKALEQIWDAIVTTVSQPRYRHFQNVTILLEAKNLKVLTKDGTWGEMMTRHRQHWTQSIDETYVTDEFFFDIGKEVCPQQASHVASSLRMDQQGGEENIDGDDARPDVEAETLLWKRCCLETYAAQLQHGFTADPTCKSCFYPFSMLQATGSLTLEPSPHAPSRAAGLMYTQLYPSSKEIFAAGNVYPFTNAAIETLALDKRLRQTWELVGGGLSHHPAALVKAYLYTKLRCHFALSGSTRKSFGVREEHRVSRALFSGIDRRIRDRGLHLSRHIVPTGLQAPFYSLPTVQLVRWLRWNINKFCVGFETVFSSQDAHFVTWEHTRIMLMFLRCLQFSYSGGLIQKSGGCWQDVRHQVDHRQADGLRRVEGLGFRRTMAERGYAWFLDKVDWNTMTFRQPHAPYMMFNNPSMQAAYHARYSQVRDVRIDFIRVDRARQWLLEFTASPACLDLLEKYLRQLCLCAFRKDVFTHIKSTLDPEHQAAALAGDVPLCYDSVSRVLDRAYGKPHLVYGHRLAVKNIDVLFTWLWDWEAVRYQRNGWDHKPYRMLYRQSFEAVVRSRGKASAEAWRRDLKQSFVCSHWLLPYPQSQGFMRKDKTTKDYVWWPSFHAGLHAYYKRWHPHRPLSDPFPASNVKHHPAEGWSLAPGSNRPTHMPWVVQPEQRLLHLCEDELYRELLDLRGRFGAGAPTPEAAVMKFVVIAPENSIGCQPGQRIKRRGSYKLNRWAPENPYIRETFTVEQCKTYEECNSFLRQGLESFEGLQQQWRESRRCRNHSPGTRVDLQSDSEDGTDLSADSGRCGIEFEDKLRHQKEVVYKIVAAMRKLIETKEQHSWRRQQISEIFVKNHTSRLKRVGIEIIPVTDRERLMSGVDVFQFQWRSEKPIC